MINIGSKAVLRSIEYYKVDVENQRASALNGLNKIKGTFNKKEKQFLTSVKKLFKDSKVITAEPNQLLDIIDEIGEVPPHLKGKKNKSKRLKDHILEALNYKGLRSSFYAKHFQIIGIKACVYCNSQLTVSIDTKEFLKTKVKRIVKAKFQVDHFHSKSVYPYLSISVFNLYPSCASCNIAKSANDVRFQLYSDEPIDGTKYCFKLEPGCVANYLLTRNLEQIEFQFSDHEKPDVKKVVKGSFQDTFDIQGIYNTQKDLVEELIIKSIVYNAQYKKNITNSFPELFTQASLSNRILIGNYSELEDIHKRPMAKFTQDIARQLNLIE